MAISLSYSSIRAPWHVLMPRLRSKTNDLLGWLKLRYRGCFRVANGCGTEARGNLVSVGDGGNERNAKGMLRDWPRENTRVQEHSCERLRLEETTRKEGDAISGLERKGEKERWGRTRERERESGEEERLQSRLIYLIASPGLQPGFNASPSGLS